MHGAIVGVKPMKQSLRPILIGGTALACFAVANLAFAQPVPPPPPAGPIAAPPPPPPQNMIIGSLSHIPYGAFAASLWPVAAASLGVATALIALIYRGEFLTRERLLTITAIPAPHHTPLVIKSVLVMVAMTVLFFAGQPVAKVAIVGGALLLFTRRVKAEKVYREIDWPLLVMFVGLFVVVAGVENAVLTPDAIAAVGRLHLGSAPALSVITAGLSNLVSNVPAVLVLKPFVADLSDPSRAWLVVAMASTLAGNFTWSDGLPT